MTNVLCVHLKKSIRNHLKPLSEFRFWFQVLVYGLIHLQTGQVQKVTQKKFFQIVSIVLGCDTTGQF